MCVQTSRISIINDEDNFDIGFNSNASIHSKNNNYQDSQQNFYYKQNNSQVENSYLIDDITD